LTNSAFAAIVEAANKRKITTAQLARVLEGMTVEQFEKLNSKIVSKVVGRLLATRRKTNGGGRPTVTKTCPHCKKEMTGRKFWRHEPGCRRKHDKTVPPRGRPLGWRKGAGGYADFKPAA